MLTTEVLMTGVLVMSEVVLVAVDSTQEMSSEVFELDDESELRGKTFEFSESSELRENIELSEIEDRSRGPSIFKIKVIFFF